MIHKACVLVLLAVAAGCSRAPAPESGQAPAKRSTAAPAPASEKAKMTEKELLEGFELQDYASVVYQDEQQQPISFDAFIAAVTSGRSFAKVAARDKSLATLTINAAEPEAGKREDKQAPIAIPVAGKMPALPGADLQGKSHRLDDGKRYTLLSFFFADCMPCIKEVPELNAFARAHDDFNVVAVTFDEKPVAEGFVQKRGLELPTIAGAQPFIDAIGVKTYPTLLLVSPEGRLVGVRASHAMASSTIEGVGKLEEWIGGLGVGVR